MTKSIVTGGAGFIGSNLADKLLELGHEVIVIDNESSIVHEQFYWNSLAKNYKLDICDYDAIRPLFDGVDYVFHLAAEARIQPSIENPLLAIKTNVLGTGNILQCSKEANVKKVIYSTTSSYYGKRNTLPNVETQIEDCLNPYSVSKVSGDKLCKMYFDLYGLKTITLRYFNVYGERQPLKGHYAPVIGLFIKQNQNNQKMTIVGDGLQRRDFTHVSDVVDANILAATEDVDTSAYGQEYNIGAGKNYSVLEIANMINEGSYTFIPERLGEARETLSSTEKFRSTFSWNSKVALDTWINENK
jgi:UDP-glucose 4-epimerase